MESPATQAAASARRRRPRPGFAVLASCAVLAASCGRAAPHADDAPEKPLSVLLVTLDTTRADALSCYAESGTTTGHGFAAPAGATPHLDALAARGVRYTRASTVAPLTLPAHASMLTGLEPPHHGLRENGLWGLPDDVETVAQRARAAGIETAAFVSSVVLDRAYGLDRGFDTWDQPARPAEQTSSHFADRTADAVVSAATAWLAKRDATRPFFAWVHFFDAHQPYAPPPRFGPAETTDAGLYEGEVRFVDEQVGRLVDALGASRADTLILVVADHGESLGEHGELSHAAYCYQPTIHVPFLVVYPNGYRAGETSDALVSVVDVGPTVLAALGLGRDAPGWKDGLSLYGRSVPADRHVYFESFSGALSFGWSPVVGVRDAHGKYLLSAAPELYDPVADPGEENDLLAADPASGAPYRTWLEKHLGGAGRTGRPAGDAGTAAVLAQLGYAAAAAGRTTLPDPFHPGDLPAPHQRAEEYQETLHASALAGAGRLEEARQLAQRLAGGNPGNVVALQTWTTCLLRLERYGEAVAPLQRLVGMRPDDAGFHYNLGVALSHAGREDDGIRSLWHAVELDPDRIAYMNELMQTLRRLGRHEEFDSYQARWRAMQSQRAERPR